MKHIPALALAAVLGCEAISSAAGNEEAKTLANDAALSVDSALKESALLLAMTDGSEPTTTPEAAAATAASKATSVFTPATCVTATASGATVTYTLDGCDGPFGLTGLSGPMVATFTTAPKGLAVNLTSSGVNLTGGKLVLNTSGVYSKSGAEQTMAISTQTVGVGASEEPITRSGNYAVTWTDTCVALSGTWANVTLDSAFSSTVANYEVCDGKCPKSGANITAAYTQGGSAGAITLQFTGSNQVSYSGTSGIGVVTLDCTR